MATTGFASATSVAPGGTIKFHLSASPAGSVHCVFERIGFGQMSETLNPTVSTRAIPANAWLGYGWPSTVTFTVPSAWPSGFYQLRAQGPGDTGHLPVLEFVVRAATPGATSKVLLAADFITAQAYNEAGGKSLYDFNSSGGVRAPKVSFNRPLAPLGGPPEIISWLSSNGLVVEHASLVDLHASSGLLDAYNCVIFGPHAEYWSKEMRDQTEAFVQAGGNVMSLSGNTCYRQVRFENSNRTLVGYKNAKADPHSDMRRQSIAFAQPPVNRPPNAMLGVGWTYGAFSGPHTPYQIHFPGHWAFAGAGGGSTIPFMHYETDGTSFAVEKEGYPRVTGEEETPLSTVILASAELGHWSGKPGVATATLLVRHGMVFAAGTTEWIGNLPNPVIGQVTRNVFGRFAARRVFDWELVGHADNVTGMAATENKLYVATSANRLWRRYPVLADVVWAQVGHANNIIAMAGTRGLLFAVTGDNTLWSRPASEVEVNWTATGSGPAGGTRALCASGSTLYAIDSAGELRSRPASASPASWAPVASLPATPRINALTSYNGVLFASTSDNRLLRTSVDFVEESKAWIDIHHCNFARGLAVVDGMLFVATSENRLWWLDLRHRALDALSAEA